MINNELYRGILIWGRRTHAKDRGTGQRRARKAAADQVTRLARPALQIVPEDLWEAAQARQAASARLGRPERARRPRRLLSGLVRCSCGELMSLTGNGRGHSYYACRRRSPRSHPGARTPRADQLEARVLEAVRTEFLHPEVIEAAVAAYREEKRRRARSDSRSKGALERELAEAQRRMARLVGQMEEGMPWAAVAARHQELADRAEQLQADLARFEPVVIEAHPNAPLRWRKLVEDLLAALEGPMDDAATAIARDAIRALVGSVQVIPLDQSGAYRLDIEGDLEPVVTGLDRWLNGGIGFPSRALAPRVLNSNEGCPLPPLAQRPRLPVRISA